MTRSTWIITILLSLMLSTGLMVVSMFADRVLSFRMKNKDGEFVEVFRPSYATWLAKAGTLIGFIGIVASLVAMFAFRNRNS